MAISVKTFLNSFDDSYREHDLFYKRAEAWLEERYGRLHSSYTNNQGAIKEYGVSHLEGNYPELTWEQLKELYFKEVGWEAPYKLDYLGRKFNDQVALWDTERNFDNENQAEHDI
jgi:hypothetical protein